MGAPYPRRKEWGPPEEAHIPEVRFANPHYTEEALSTLAAIYQYQAVQRSMSKWSPEEEGFLDHRGNLLRGGAEEWMFQPLPATGPERRLFFEENAPRSREELQKVFPRFWLIQPRHAQAIGGGTDPFVPKEGDPQDPLVYQDVGIVDDDPRYQWAPIQDEETNTTRHMLIHPEYGQEEEEPGLGGTLSSLWSAGKTLALEYGQIPWKTRAALGMVAPGPAAAMGTGSRAASRIKQEFSKASRMREEQGKELRAETEAQLRSSPAWQRGYQGEMLRLQEAAESGDLLGPAGGFKGTFGAEGVIDKAAPSVWRGQTEKVSRESERGKSTSEELGAAEARAKVLERAGKVQYDLQEIQRKFSKGEISEDAYSRGISSTLGLEVPPPTTEAPPQQAAPTTAPTQQPVEKPTTPQRAPLPPRINW